MWTFSLIHSPCQEAQGEYGAAEEIYHAMLEENPGNMVNSP